ncbi:MAG: hypothetical protein H6Q89_3761 [Myxococcaceae bacterium]|nr:hypothetical protein [Myxococcaceae bacterium]
MANLLRFFMTNEDEIAFLRYLERHVLKVYPRRVPPDWVEFRAHASVFAQLPEEDLYLAATDIGPVQVDRMKRGPDKGFWRVLEVGSPVIYWDRSRPNFDNELQSGQLWAELDVTQQTGRRNPAPDKFRTLFNEVEAWIHKAYRRGDPKEFWIGPHAARATKESGLVLRDNEHKGGTVDLWR